MDTGRGGGREEREKRCAAAELLRMRSRCVTTHTLSHAKSDARAHVIGPETMPRCEVCVRKKRPPAFPGDCTLPALGQHIPQVFAARRQECRGVEVRTQQWRRLQQLHPKPPARPHGRASVGAAADRAEHAGTDRVLKGTHGYLGWTCPCMSSSKCSASVSKANVALYACAGDERHNERRQGRSLPPSTIDNGRQAVAPPRNPCCMPYVVLLPAARCMSCQECCPSRAA